MCFDARMIRRTRGFSTAVVLVLVLILALMGFVFLTRGPTESRVAGGGESLPEVDGAEGRDPGPGKAEPALDGLQDSLDTVVEAVEEPSPQGIPRDQSRVGRMPVEGGGLPDRSTGSPDVGIPRSPEQRRADREARRARAMGPATAAEAIARVMSPEGSEAALRLDGGWIPPDDSVLSDLSPDLRERLGLDSSEEGSLDQPPIESDSRLVVVDYTYGSPGKRAGLEVGDEIIRYFGEPVRNLRQLKALMALAESFGPKRVDIQVQGSDGIHDLEIKPGRLGVILNGE